MILKILIESAAAKRERELKEEEYLRDETEELERQIAEHRPLAELEAEYEALKRQLENLTKYWNEIDSC